MCCGHKAIYCVRCAACNRLVCKLRFCALASCAEQGHVCVSTALLGIKHLIKAHGNYQVQPLDQALQERDVSHVLGQDNESQN